jgi:hypothetical protein
MIAVHHPSKEILLDLQAHSVAEIPDLCRSFLSLTDAPERAFAWRTARRQCRRLLQQCERPGYGASEDACWDLDWLCDLLGDVLPDGDDLCLDLEFLVAV